LLMHRRPGTRGQGWPVPEGELDPTGMPIGKSSV
jgi:hypothetical protein